MRRRRLAREIAVQTLYEMAQSDVAMRQALQTNVERREGGDAERAYAERLLHAVEAQRDTIRAHLVAALANWSWERVALVDRCVLQVSAAELLGFSDVPVRVSIDEAIEIARKFGSEESGAFVNGVLDRVARDLQPQSDTARGSTRSEA